MSKKLSFISRHVLEVRQKKRVFDFIDYKGELADYLLDKTKFNKIKVENDGVRVEVASENLDEVYFISFENFGFQIDAKSDFDIFITTATKLFNLLVDFPKYRIGDILRIGTKSTLFCNIPSRSQEGLKELFFNKLFSNKDNFESKTGLKTTDLAFTFLDANSSSHKAHIMFGPSNLEESIIRYFGKKELYETFSKKSGIFYEIDSYLDNAGNLSLDKIKDQIILQIKSNEQSFNGFVSLFEEKTK